MCASPPSPGGWSDSQFPATSLHTIAIEPFQPFRRPVYTSSGFALEGPHFVHPTVSPYRFSRYPSNPPTLDHMVAGGLPSGLTTLRLDWRGDGVVEVALSRPNKSNSITPAMWAELRAVFGTHLPGLEGLRAVVVTGSGKNFCGGIDLGAFGGDGAVSSGDDVARSALRLRTHILELQDSLSAIEKLPVPVIAAVHGACYGAGLDMASACCIRWACPDAMFSIKEVDVGLAADVGSLARLPRALGSSSLLNELAYTARPLTAAEALQCGLVSRVLVPLPCELAPRAPTLLALPALGCCARLGNACRLQLASDVPAPSLAVGAA